jgi:hypothetical protein
MAALPILREADFNSLNINGSCEGRVGVRIPAGDGQHSKVVEPGVDIRYGIGHGYQPQVTKTRIGSIGEDGQEVSVDMLPLRSSLSWLLAVPVWILFE